MTSAQIRQTFLDFFKSKGHEIVPSAPMVVKNDPTLMFINSGMAPFKNIFLGNSPIKHPRVADTQKCLRVSGKHNDLEEVGVDTYHHTMFEMLGNWSFGDYFKKEAIAWSWELLTEVYKLPKENLYVTVFEGSKEDKLDFDQEAYDTWKQFIAEDRILRGNKKDNFWEMGDTGPCGPCSEIHVDLRDEAEKKKSPGHTMVNTGHPQVIEIWNNVFMEFNRKADGSLEKLPAQHVDTGMGFERLCVALQGKKSNYDTDVFQPLIQKISTLSGKKYNGDDTSAKQEPINIATRVIADHIRTISFSIADGQLPSNTGAGYVIRRILRRAVRYGYQTLNLKEPFLCQLVDTLAGQMGQAFPELNTQKALIEKVIREEEQSFFRTLEQGIKRFENELEEIGGPRKSSKEVASYFSGAVAFELSDTFGFPLDLTELMAREKGFAGVDMKEFNECLEKQKNRSREATTIEAGDWESTLDLDGDGNTKFIGYEATLAEDVKILAYRKIKVKSKEQYQFTLNKTPFYAESGGQVGDTGFIESKEGEKIFIVDTRKENGRWIHVAEKLPIKSDDIFFRRFKASVNNTKRKLIANNHSATHLLHAALRNVLGTHVEQKGSLVNDEYLRFDFSHFTKVTDAELAQIEKLVNEKIRENIAVDIKEMPIDEAKKLGAMALFGEKYGDTVRVVTMDKTYSIELCGGTHVASTGNIGLFKISSESAVAAGVRRIEAITSVKAEEFLNNELKTLAEVKELLKNPKDLVKGVQQVLDQNNELQKQVELLLKEKAKNVKSDLLTKVKQINGVSFIAEKIELNSADAIKNISFELRDQVANLFMVLGAEVNGKPSLTVAISDTLVKEKNLNAGNIVRELAKEIQGGGGGQAFYATAGGTLSSGVGKALEKAKSLI